MNGTSSTEQSSSESKLTTSLPLSFSDDLSNVEQWSQLMGETNTRASSQAQQASIITSVLPSTSEYQDERHLAHPLEQRATVDSVATAGRVSTVAQPTVALDDHVLGDTSIALDQVRRTETPQPYEYKAPADVRESLGTMMRTSASTKGVDDETAQETAVSVSHLRQPELGGVKQQTTSVSQPSVSTDLPIMEESAIHLDQIQRQQLPQTVQYKAPVDLQPSAGSLMTSAAALSQEEPAQETSININQFSQPIAKDLPSSQSTERQASSVTEFSAAADLPIMAESSIHLDQVQRPEVPRTVQYKAPADIQPSTGSLMTIATTAGQEDLAPETSLNITQVRQQQAGASKQQTASVSQPSLTADELASDETGIQLGQFRRSEVSETVQYKAPADLQPSAGSLMTTAAALGQEEPAQETSVNIAQFSQPIAKDVLSPQSTERQASSVTQVSAAADLPLMEESSIHLNQIQRPEVPQTVQYKAPADLQPSAGSLMTNAAALSQEEPAQETSINITQFTQPIAQDASPSNTAERQASSVTQVSAAADEPIMEESSIHLDQIQRPEVPQTIQYKAPADLQPSTGSMLTSAAALSQEEPAQETPVSITQFSQPFAKDRPSSEPLERRASSVTQLSTATAHPIFEETAIYLNQSQRPDAPQTVQYKAPAGIQPSTGSILISTSALGEEQHPEETPLNASQLRQATAQGLPDGRQRASAITQPVMGSDLPIFDQTALQIGQIQRAHEAQAFEYQAPADIKEGTANLHSSPSAMASGIEYDDSILTSIESYQQQQGYKAQRPSVVSDRSYAAAEDDDDQIHSTAVGKRRLMVPSVKEPLEVKDEQEEQKKEDEGEEKSAPTTVDEVIETTRPDEEPKESEKPPVLDTLSTTEEEPLSTAGPAEAQQLKDVSLVDVLHIEDDQSVPAFVQKTEEPLEVLSSQIIDYIEIPSTENDVNDRKPEAIIVTAETKPTEEIVSTPSMYH